MGPPDTWDAMAEWLGGLGETVGSKPTAILLVSGHWETPELTVTSGEHPELIYDYGGFPPHTYELRYDAPGLPTLAGRVCGLLGAAGIACHEDAQRGFDHGVFIPLKLVYPDAAIPIVQLSLKGDLDPAAHLEAGNAIEPLRDEGVLIVGSGMSYHNMDGYSTGHARTHSDPFDGWLTKICSLAPADRDRELRQWQEAPSGRESHPREEHLLPLMVVAGAAGDDRGERLFTDRVMDATVSGFGFGLPADPAVRTVRSGSVARVRSPAGQERNQR